MCGAVRCGALGRCVQRIQKASVCKRLSVGNESVAEALNDNDNDNEKRLSAVLLLLLLLLHKRPQDT